MNDNTLRARLDFSFKGESHELDTTIDLDPLLDTEDEAPDFHRLLAAASGIDTYSYLYEAMESYEIEFSEPTGLAIRSCHDGRFDWPRFRQDCRDEQDLQVVRTIAEQTLVVRNLDERPDLKAALLAAYRAGKQVRG